MSPTRPGSTSRTGTERPSSYARRRPPRSKPHSRGPRSPPCSCPRSNGSCSISTCASSPMAAERPVATYSIVACDLDAQQWGVAVQSKFLAVGSVVPWAEPGVGAVATQSYANPRYGPDGLALLREGKSAQETIDALTASDKDRDQRQVGIVDVHGRGATFTGSGCQDWAGGRTGDGYAAQGNILVSAATVDALATTFEANGHLELPERLIECLTAAQAAGGD